jgi:hypothetical protein
MPDICRDTLGDVPLEDFLFSYWLTATPPGCSPLSLPPPPSLSLYRAPKRSGMLGNAAGWSPTNVDISQSI